LERYPGRTSAYEAKLGGAFKQKHRLDIVHSFMKLALVLILVASFGVAVTESANAQVEGGAIAAIDEPIEALGGGGSTAKKYGTSRKATATKTARPSSKPAAKPKPPPWNGFVIGDEYTFLNFEVISAEKPYYTRAAKAGGASGLVQVEVLIDTNGSVIAVRARTGNKLLHAEAERAALASKFNRPTVYGKPARAIGFLVYRFGSEADEVRPMPKRYDFESPFKKNK
jgi:hypothetical protein